MRASGAFGGGFTGCPHVGGALAAGSGGVHALVWTGKEDKAGLYVSSSADGLAWGDPVKLGGAGAKHGDLASSGSRLAAVWSDGGRIWSAASADGQSWSKPKALSGKSSTSSYPRVVIVGKGFRAFWREKDRFNDAPLD